MGAVPTRSPTHEPAANEAMTNTTTTATPLPPLLAAARGDARIVPVLASAPGKAILFGEHAVVYGKTAIATAVDLRSYVLLYPAPTSRGAVTIVFPDIHFRVAVPLESLKPFTRAPSPTSAPRDLDLDRRAALTAIITARCRDVLPTQLAAALAVLHLLLELCGDTVPPFTLVLRSEIPVGSGLGSSASLSVALAVAMLAGFGVVGFGEMEEEVGSAKRKRARTTSGEVAKDDKKEAMLTTVNAWGFASEKVIHGNPSGVDNTVVTYGGSLAYTKGAGMVPLTGCAAFEFLLTNTLVEKNTKIQVDKVRRRRDLLPTVIDPVLDAMHHLATTAQSLLTADSADLSPLIHVNQTLLAALDASHPAIEQVVALTAAHGLPSKLTGAGGGGCVMTYVPPGTESGTVETTMAELRAAGFDTFKTQVGGMGVALHQAAADAPVARVGEKRARDDETEEVKDWDAWMARFEKVPANELREMVGTPSGAGTPVLLSPPSPSRVGEKEVESVVKPVEKAEVVAKKSVAKAAPARPRRSQRHK